MKEAPELAIAFHGSNSFKVIPSNCDLNLLGDMIISMAVKIGVPNKVRKYFILMSFKI